MHKFSKKFLSLILAIIMLTMTAIGVSAEELIIGTTDLLIDIGIIDPSPEEELMPMAVNNYCYTIYSSLHSSDEYDENFSSSMQPKYSDINNMSVLEYLQSEEPGTWKKVYHDGYIDGEKVSCHYYYNKTTGAVADVKYKEGWSYAG